MLIPPAFAQAATGAAPGSAAFFFTLVPYVFIFIIFYFLLIRPQAQRAKAQRAMIDAVKRGDQVVTGGGIMGKVTKVDGDAVEVEIAANVRIRVVKMTLTEVTPTGGAKPAND